jgi:hypothetical protein
MKQLIHISEVEGKQSVCFDTGLEPRSFARTKMSQSLIESGYVVHSDGSHEVWKAAGVSEVNGHMRVWGPVFKGERLDLLIDNLNDANQTQAQFEEARQTALQAVVFWIRAKMLLGDTHSVFNPGAAFILCEEGKGSVFFAPPNLSNRCLIVEGREIDRYNCPDLTGIESAAFCAGVMLYRILSNVLPYQEDATIFQDMREGVFLPPHLAAPSLNKELCSLIHSALLLPVEKKRSAKSGADIIGSFLQTFMVSENRIIPASSLFKQLSPEETEHISGEKKRYLFKQNAFVKTRRFALRNKYALIGSVVGVLFIAFIFVSTSNSMSRRPTTSGMAPDTVITAYYDAFSSLDHIFMEACVSGADKSDINTAVTLFAVYKTRQAYEVSTRSSIIPARVWLHTGGELPAPDVFGVTELNVKYKAGTEKENMVMFEADYLLWSPDLSYPIKRSDVLTLKRDRRKNWRISEILRTEG